MAQSSPLNSARTRLAACGVDPGTVIEHFARSSGPGGQNVNKVESAVRLFHAPTGLDAAAADHRSQAANRLLAWERLAAAAERRRQAARLAAAALRAKRRRQAARRSRTTKAKLVESKRRRAETKKLRGRVTPA